MQELWTDWLMVVGVCFISSCITTGLICIVCCFWSKCLLFNCCRSKYNNTFIIPYGNYEFYGADKPEEAMNLPPEEINNSNCYSPVRMKKLEMFDC